MPWPSRESPAWEFSDRMPAKMWLVALERGCGRCGFGLHVDEVERGIAFDGPRPAQRRCSRISCVCDWRTPRNPTSVPGRDCLHDGRPVVCHGQISAGRDQERATYGVLSAAPPFGYSCPRLVAGAIAQGRGLAAECKVHRGASWRPPPLRKDWRWQFAVAPILRVRRRRLAIRRYHGLDEARPQHHAATIGSWRSQRGRAQG